MKYENFENTCINNIDSGDKDADGKCIPTNELDLLIKNNLGKLIPTDYVLNGMEVDVDMTTHGGIYTLQTYLLDMQHYIDTDIMNDDGGYDNNPRETQILKGFQILLALYDVMNRDVISQRKQLK